MRFLPPITTLVNVVRAAASPARAATRPASITVFEARECPYCAPDERCAFHV